jgi:hypothetical protein
VDGLDISLVRDAAHDAQLPIQSPAVNGEIEVHRVVVRGEQHRGALMDAGALDQLAIRGVTRKHLVDDVRKRLQRGALTIDRVHHDPLALERLGGGLPDFPGADDEHGRRRPIAR